MGVGVGVGVGVGGRVRAGAGHLSAHVLVVKTSILVDFTTKTCAFSEVTVIGC